MGIPAKIITSLAGPFVIYVLTQAYLFLTAIASAWMRQQDKYQIQYLIIIALLLTIITLMMVIILRYPRRKEEPENDLVPKILFSDIMIFRKIKRGIRTEDPIKSFALSPKIGVINNVEVLDTRMSLFYCIYKQVNDGNGSIVRDGVEEVTSDASYIEMVHRYSFYSEKLPFKILERIVSVSGKPSDDRIVIVLTGSYGKDLRKFWCKHVYSSKDIIIADETPKVIEYAIQDGEEIQKPDWAKLHRYIPLDDSALHARVEELKQLVRDRHVPS